MSNCDCQKNIKKSINDQCTIDATAAKKPIGDGRLVTTVAATSGRIFFGLRAVDMGQYNSLLTSTSLVYLLSFFDLMIKKPYTINE